MLRQFLRPYQPKQVPVLSFGTAPSAWAHWAAVATRGWSLAPARPAAGPRLHPSRLMAAVHTDIVDYSRLFALDGVGTIIRLRELRRGVVAPAIRRHRARLVQTAGDSMLIMFNSVAGAVRCALSIQHELAIANGSWPDDRQMHLRVGVDLGDIILDGTVLHGDGVIVAARLQAVCPPGGVCVSRTVRDRGGDQLGLRCDALGALTLKNVPRPVEAFVLWPSPHEGARAKAIGRARGA